MSPDTDEGLRAVLKMMESEFTAYREGGKYGKMFPRRWIPSAFGILDQGFTEDNQMLNSTLKMVRGKITESFKDRIVYLYTPSAKDIANKVNIENMRRFLQ